MRGVYERVMDRMQRALKAQQSAVAYAKRMGLTHNESIALLEQHGTMGAVSRDDRSLEAVEAEDRMNDLVWPPMGRQAVQPMESEGDNA